MTTDRQDPHNVALFNKLFRLYYNSLVGFAQSYLNDDADAQDVVQDVFTKIWKMIDKVDNDRNIKSLMFTATRNQCISALRTRLSRKNTDSLKNEIELVALEYSSLESIEFTDLRAQVERIMSSLPEDYQDIFLKNRLHGMSYPDIALQNGISVKTVEKKISLTLKNFRLKLIK